MNSQKQRLATLFLWGGALLIVVGIALSYARLVPLVESAFYSEQIPTAPPLLVSTQSTPSVLMPWSAEEEAPDADSPDPTETPTAEPPTGTPSSESLPTDPPPALVEPTDVSVEPTDAPIDAPTLTPEPTAVPATPTPAPAPTSTVPPPLAPTGILPQSMQIPDISLEAPVVPIGWKIERIDGQNQAIWDVPDSRAAGWHNTSARLGIVGNTVFNGHNTSNGEVFRDLYKLELGAQIYVEGDDGETYLYEVGEKYILREAGQPLSVRLENARYIQETSDERLTLVTCHPYGSLANRLLIIAYPVRESVAEERME